MLEKVADGESGHGGCGDGLVTVDGAVILLTPGY